MVQDLQVEQIGDIVVHAYVSRELGEFRDTGPERIIGVSIKPGQHT
jgi:hypothetical protein